MTNNQLRTLKPGSKIRIISHTKPHFLYGEVYEVEYVNPRVWLWNGVQPGVAIVNRWQYVYADEMERVK